MACNYFPVRATILDKMVCQTTSQNITIRQLRILLSIIEIHAVQTATKSEYKVTVPKIQQLTGIKIAQAIKRDLKQLEKLGLVQTCDDRFLLNDEQILGSERSILEAISPGRSATRYVPFPRKLLKTLLTSSRRGVHITSLLLLLRGSSLNQNKTVKNKCSVKMELIATIGSVTKRTVIEAFNFLRENSFIKTEKPRFIQKLFKDGLFVRIQFGKKSTTKISSGKQLPTSRFSPKERDIKPSTKDEKKSHTPDIFNIEKKKLNNFDYCIGLFKDAVRRNTMTNSFCSLLNVCSAAKQALTKARCPEKLVGYMIHKGDFNGIDDKIESYVHPRLKRYLEANDLVVT